MHEYLKSVVEILEEHGLQPRRKGYSNGGEFASPCPFCQDGEDRFLTWPNHPSGVGGRFWCRRCQENGDGVQLLVRLEGIDERQAMKRLRTTHEAVLEARGKAREEAKRSKRTPPPSVWQQSADTFVRRCADELWSYGDWVLDWLTEERGLTDKTIRRAELGFLERDDYEEGDDWGLKMEIKPETGKAKRVWLPGPSLVIPTRQEGRVQSLRFRLFDQKRDWMEDGEQLPRYMALRGSAGGTALRLGIEDGKPVVVVESALCGLLIHQEAGDLVGVLALGSAYYDPPRRDPMFEQNRPVLVCLDQDRAGSYNTQLSWINPHQEAAVVLRLPPGKAKDPTEAWQAGLDLHDWVATGLENARQELERRLAACEVGPGELPF